MRVESAPAQPLPLTFTLLAGDTLVRQGEPSGLAWVVLSGALWESCVSEQGRTLATRLLGPGDLAGTGDDRPSPATVRAVRASRLRHASAAELRGLVSARERTTLELALDLAWLDVATRLDRRLNDLAHRFGREAPGGVLIDLRLSHEDLAALAGCSRESASRALRSLERAGRVRTLRRGRYLLRPGLSAVSR